MSEIDWAALQKDADDVLLPDGEYPVIISKSDAVTASTGKPMVKIQGTITNGAKKDRKIFTQLTLTTDNPFALKMWFNNLAAFGLGPDYFARKPSMEQLARDLVNRVATFVVSSREWNGAPRNQVDAIKAIPAGSPTPPGAVVGLPAAGPTPGGPMSATASPASPLATAPTPSVTPTAPVAPVTAPPQPPAF